MGLGQPRPASLVVDEDLSLSFLSSGGAQSQYHPPPPPSSCKVFIEIMLAKQLAQSLTHVHVQ